MCEEFLAQYRVASTHVVDQLTRFAAEGPHHADARERLAHAAVDDLGVLAHGAVDGPDPLRGPEADEYRAGDDGHRHQREPPVERHQHADADDEPDDGQRRRHDRHLQQAGGRLRVAGEARQDPTRLHVPQFRQR